MTRSRALVSWLGAHRSLVATLVSGTVVSALVATVAVVSGGYSAQRLDLGDAAVWVTNENRQVVGRANTEVLELNTVVTAASESLDLVQQGATVLVVDHGNSSLDILDPATAQVADSVPLPPQEPSVLLAGDRAVVAADGDMWSMPVTEVADFDSTLAPTLALGTGAVVSLDPAGVFYSFTPATGDLVRVDTAVSDAVVSTVTVDAGDAEDSYQLTSVRGRWALLNASTGSLFLPGQEVRIPEATGPVLQQASRDGDRVLVGHRGGLLGVGLTGSAPVSLVTERSGTPAAPVVVADCSYAAWGDGAAWHSCADTGAQSATLAGVAGDARLQFRQNGTTLVLNDARNGAAWAVQRGNELIDNWDDLIDTVADQQRVEENTADTPPEFEQAQLPPVAVDDEFGARPGRTVTLPVLLNDYDPNADVLMITQVTPIPDAQGRLDLVGNNQQVQLTVSAAATGVLGFDYTISDGRGGTASASVQVTIRADSENSPPVQVRSTDMTMHSGGRVTRQVLGDWVDPDGDPFYLAAATIAPPDQVGFTPDGAVTVTEVAAGAGAAERQVGLRVSDGSLDGTGSLRVFVKPAGSVPIIADTFLVLATAGTEITVSPLEHVRGGSAPLRLGSVPAKPDTVITPDFVANTFRFQSSVVGEHYLEYAVTDGALTATGLVRVQVAPAPDANSTPVTVPHTAFIRGQQSTLINVLAGDTDPAGGVLLVTGTMNVPADSGLRVEILEQRVLRVTLTKPLEAGPVTFNYRVSNGLSGADGTVTVIELPALVRKQAPVAMADTVSVRVGDAIDIPVLANDQHPDGDMLTLDPDLATDLAPEAGLLFTSGSVLRYFAPATAGNFVAVYRVTAPDGQFANAEVRISVREADAASNNAPVPRTVTARVLAGETVRIPIPLAGIDADGDSVQLLGQESNPDKGAVILVGPDWIDYESGDYSAGTDSFGYAVVDALGARATGIVRVGISPRLDGARNPIAAPDEVLVRPGGTVSVRVLGNDSDPDGGELRLLRVTNVEPGDQNGTATIEDDVLSVRVPPREGRYGFIYEIENDRGGSGSTFLTVVVDEDAPLSRPDVGDTRLTLTDVLDRTSIDVDVLANVFFADGPVTELGLAVLPGFTDNARVTGDHRIRVTVGDTSQIIPFSVTHPDDPDIVSYGFIRVPGYGDALPQLRTGQERLSIPSESTLRIDINDYVVAVAGKPVRLTDRSSVRATHADGATLATDDQTLAFTSADRYFGPASISFEVTDGSGAADPDGRTAIIVLPIDVTPRENQPPSFDGAVIDFEPDQTKVIDLTRLTSYPYPDDQAELAYTVLEPHPTGFSYSLDGQLLTLRATEGTPKGSRSPITIGVHDDLAAGTAGRIDLAVVASTRPHAIPAADTAIAPRGETTVVDVLANDGATNPFPAVGLRVVAVRGLDGGGPGGTDLPAGVAVTPSADNSRLSFRVAADAAPVDTTLQYQVADATNDPARYAWGTVRISVQDAPEPVTNLQATGFGDGTLSVSFNAGAANNSPVTGYQVALLDAGSGAVVSTTACPATACTVATTGNGQNHAVRASVWAQNAIGSSDATTLPSPVWSDVVPSAPTGLTAAPLDGGLRLSWNAVAAVGGGTAVRAYALSVDGSARGDVSATGPACSASGCTLDVGGLHNGADVTFKVSARNDAYPALSSWNSSAGRGTPFGEARAGGIAATGTDATGTVQVTWDAFADSGNAIRGYYVQRISGSDVPTGAQACTVSAPAPGDVTAPRAGGRVVDQKEVSAGTTSAAFEGLLADNGSYSFVVWGYNQAGCAATAVASVSLRPGPGAVTDVEGAMAARGDAWDFRVTNTSGASDRYNLRAVDAAGAPLSGDVVGFSGQGWPREALGGAFGETVRFQVQGCTVWNACGPWSSTQAAPEPSVSFTVAGLAYDENSGVFSWTNDPGNGPDYPATYQCMVRSESSVTPAQTANSCTLPAPSAAGTVRLTVTVNGHDYDYNE